MKISGELDIATVGIFKTEIDTALSTDARPFIVDLSTCSFVDSTGVGALLDLHHTLRDSGRSLLVLPGSRAVRRTFKVMAIDRVLPIAAAA